MFHANFFMVKKLLKIFLKKYGFCVIHHHRKFINTLMKKVIYLAGFVFLLCGTAFVFLSYTQPGKRIKAFYFPKQSVTRTGTTVIRDEKLEEKITASKTFTKEKGYNTSICFLIDMSKHSGANRFVVYDLEKDSVLNSAPVTHGRCNENWLEGRKYGNEVGCGCTSLGKYKIGYAYQGRFGLAYKLHGLDKTNNKAFDRFVVLHAHECVPDKAVTEDICQSDGCPTVSPGFLKYLKTMINGSKKPVLLWIYE